MTKLDDAERSIIREWDTWAPNQSDPASLRDAFYRHLQKERPELLKFRYAGDKWQRVYGACQERGASENRDRSQILSACAAARPKR
jgi:hypothetical protein